MQRNEMIPLHISHRDFSPIQKTPIFLIIWPGRMCSKRFLGFLSMFIGNNPSDLDPEKWLVAQFSFVLLLFGK